MRKIAHTIREAFFRMLIYSFKPHKVKKISYDLGISTLTCHRDVDSLIYSLLSFFSSTHQILPVYIVNDGSLTEHDLRKLRTYLTVIIEEKIAAETKMKRIIEFTKFRFQDSKDIYMEKLAAVLLNPFSKFIYMDSDVLFLREPIEIRRWMSRNHLISYYAEHSAYLTNFDDNEIAKVYFSYRKLLYKYLSCKTPASFNFGLLCIAHKKAISVQKLNKISKLLRNISYAYLLADEAAIGYALDSGLLRGLPKHKYVCVASAGEYKQNFSSQTASIHYLGEMKFSRFKTDAIKVALRNKLFRSIDRGGYGN